MNYIGKKCLITGVDNGFIGNPLKNALEKNGALVSVYNEDVRNIKQLENYFSPQLHYVFHFGSPSSQTTFKKNIRYCVDSTINGFLNISDLCFKYGVKLIYPSTGLLQQDRYNEYARSKKILEDIHLNSKIDALGLRIFASYGSNENHKRDYASPIYLFCRDMVNNISPIIWGNGDQTRDFIYIDDLINSILYLTETANEPIIGIGSGISTSFNTIVNLINKTLNKNIAPIYIDKPINYYDNTLCDTSIMKKYNLSTSVSIEEGIQKICQTLL